MNSQQPKSFRFTDKKAEQENLFGSKNEMQNKTGQGVTAEIEFTFILKKIFLSMKKLFVAIKYQFFKLTGGALSGMKLPWLKIAVVAMLAYLMFEKDFQFTVNMRAPSAFLPVDEEDNKRSDVAQMGIAQAVAHHEKARNPFADARDDDAKTKKEKAYIRRFKKTAQEEMKKFGIPASVKMAQGLLESGAGHSGLAKRNNNHFGIKCFSKKCKKQP
jgi:flagellum-specific peptidoglycan hydrolase FlgJ